MLRANWPAGGLFFRRKSVSKEIFFQVVLARKAAVHLLHCRVGGAPQWQIVPQFASGAIMAERDESTTDAIDPKSRTIRQLVFSQSFLAF